METVKQNPHKRQSKKQTPRGNHYPFLEYLLRFLFIFLRKTKIQRESIEGGAELSVEQSAQPRVQFQDPQIMTPVKGRHLIDGATQAPLQSIF